MGTALDVIVAAATNPGAGPAALVPVPGDSLTVRNADLATSIFLENVNRLGAAAGLVRLRSPRMHDNLQGLRLRGSAANSRPLLSWEHEQRLWPQDLLIAEISGGAAEVDGAAMFLFYQDLPGVAARLMTWDQIQPRMVNLVGVEVDTVTSGTAFNWADTALTATFDTLKSGVDYAVLGYESDTEVLAVGVKGPDTGNLRCAGPGTTERVYTDNWFVDNARHANRAWVPVINAANKGTTFVSVAHSALGAAVNVNLILAELHP